MAYRAEAHKSFSKELCDAHCILQSVQKNVQSLCLNGLAHEK